MPKRKKSRKRKKVFPKVAEAAFGPKLGKIWPNFVESFPDLHQKWWLPLANVWPNEAPIWYKLWVIWGCLWHNLGGGFDTKSHCSVSSSNVLQCILLFNFGVNLGPRDWEIFLRVCENFYSGPIASGHVMHTLASCPNAPICTWTWCRWCASDAQVHIGAFGHDVHLGMMHIFAIGPL